LGGRHTYCLPCGARGANISTADLFADDSAPPGGDEPLGQYGRILRGYALPYVPQLLAAIQTIADQAPFRHMETSGGFTMSVALTNCGHLGWVSDRKGYRYAALAPDSGLPWPAMPAVFARLAHAAAQAGFAAFCPDACLISRYLPGARLSLHQDRNERDLSAPIVSVSLGMSAVFLFGGTRRSDRVMKIPLFHGDVAVWGGSKRLNYHGIAPLKDRPHAMLGSQRFNFTLRKVE